MNVKKYFLVALFLSAIILLPTIAFALDKKITAPSGNLILDAATGSQVKINKQLQVTTTPSSVNFAQTNVEGGWGGSITLGLGSAGGYRQLVATTILFNYTNSNGTYCGVSVTGFIKDGSTVLATKAFGYGVSIPFNNKLSYSMTVLVPTPVAGSYTIVWQDTEGDGCSKTLSATSISASSSNLW